MGKRKGSSTSRPRVRARVSRWDPGWCDAREAENAQRLLTKLPEEVWGKILNHLDENDLFPLALSCRFFRQKQKELVAQTRQSRPESGAPRRALKTNLQRKLEEGQPASAEYLRFCSNVKVGMQFRKRRVRYIKRLAAFHGHLPLLQELLEPANTIDPEITRAAARGGQMETLQWLKTQEGFALDGWLFRKACQDGNMEILKWLRSEGCPWDEWACTYAAEGGHLEVLKWLRSEGCPWDEWTCAAAAEWGHLDVLKYAHENGCPWDDKTCSGAAEGGHLDVLKYLHENGCPWDVWTWYGSEGRKAMRKWLKENGCPQQPED